eukprot:PhF_6_TR24458/c0_g1_i1/m.33818
MPHKVQHFHVYPSEYAILYASVFVVMIHEYMLRHYIAKATFSRLGTFIRLFGCILLANMGMLHYHKNIISESVTFIIIAVVGFLPLTLVQVYRRRWWAFSYMAMLWVATVWKYVSVDRHPNTEVLGIFKKLERLTPISFFVPCLHPELAKLSKGVTAPLWSVIGIFFVMEVELVYRVLLEVFVGSVGSRRQASLATETLAVFVVLGATWDNL